MKKKKRRAEETAKRIPAKLKAEAEVVADHPAPNAVPIEQAVIAAQGAALAAQFLLGELLIDVARLHSSPERYLGSLFERVARRADPRDLKIPEKAVYGLARAILEDVFAGAARQLRKDRGQATPGERGS